MSEAIGQGYLQTGPKNTENRLEMPLSGITVIELGRVLAAPLCGMMLADAGARVIKIEAPTGGDDSRSYGPPFLGSESSYFMALNRSKASLTLDLRKKQAQEAFLRLAEGADVFVHNFRPTAIARMGLEYERLRAVNERLIYCAVSGYGAAGPRRDDAAFDMIVQAEGGISSLNRPNGTLPVKAPVPVSDLATGMNAAFAIVAALRQREVTGAGQLVTTSLLESTVALLTFLAGKYFAEGVSPISYGNAHPSIVPYDLFPTKDGHIAIAVVNDSSWKRFCRALELEMLLNDDRFRTNSDRVLHKRELYEILFAKLANLSQAHVFAALREVGIPVGKANDLSEVFHDPQILALSIRRRTTHPTAGEISQIAPPFHFHGGALEAPLGPPPILGEHTCEILQSLGYTDAQIHEMREEGAASFDVGSRI